MNEGRVIEAREQRPPVLATVAPLLYVFACALAVRSVLLDSSIDVGITGLFVALGFAPAFTLPVIFGTRRADLALSADGLVVDGRLCKVSDVRLSHAARGTGRLDLEMRDGTTRTFVVASYKDAQLIVAALPPVSAPAGALAA